MAARVRRTGTGDLWQQHLGESDAGRDRVYPRVTVSEGSETGL